jgi:hypothetical protein
VGFLSWPELSRGSAAVAVFRGHSPDSRCQPDSSRCGCDGTIGIDGWSQGIAVEARQHPPGATPLSQSRMAPFLAIQMMEVRARCCPSAAGEMTFVNYRTDLRGAPRFPSLKEGTA